MRVVITGSKGQLGAALVAAFAHAERLEIDLPEHDITDLGIVDTVAGFAPDLIIHGAAITNVDGCEADPELAYRVNAIGSRNLALAAQRLDRPIIYISTDYVFDGAKETPYWETDAPNPLSVYAATKLAGEQLVRELAPRHHVARIAWLYGHSPRNFCQTVLRLARERGEMTMVTDEVGSPTYAPDVARALVALAPTGAYGTYHLTNSGVCSRHEWACAILELAGLGHVPVHAAQEYQRAARVPKRVELRNAFGAAIGITMRPWREALAEYLASLELS
jgi:dTDP-4-dehydrorhamnose reductase